MTTRAERERVETYLGKRSPHASPMTKKAALLHATFEDRIREFLLHPHHEDYAHPLLVIWLCERCHFIRHDRDEPPVGETRRFRVKNFCEFRFRKKVKAHDKLEEIVLRLLGSENATLQDG